MDIFLGGANFMKYKNLQKDKKISNLNKYSKKTKKSVIR